MGVAGAILGVFVATCGGVLVTFGEFADGSTRGFLWESGVEVVSGAGRLARKNFQSIRQEFKFIKKCVLVTLGG